MAKTKAKVKCELGMIGLGTMGRNLLLNLVDHGFPVACFDRNPDQAKTFAREEAEGRVEAATTLPMLAALLKRPRVVMLLVPAGAPVDEVLKKIVPHLAPGDIVIDGGNSHFRDTERRQRTLGRKGLVLLGVGVSGGEAGARHGPSLMPGGPAEAYERVRPMFEAVAAQVGDQPCAAWCGPGGAGHYVKMVHNGIEYGLMQLIAEVYDLMTRGLGLSTAEVRDVFRDWNASELNSFLVEITATVLDATDPKTGRPLVEMIRDAARQKGTGAWTTASAAELQTPVPTIDLAVAMRDLSGDTAQRTAVLEALGEADGASFGGDTDVLLGQLRGALYAAMIVTYAQGMALLRAASAANKWAVDLEMVSRIWRGGCIIRAALLEKLRLAYQKNPALLHLLADAELAGEVVRRQEELRTAVAAAVELAIPAPALAASLAYLDSYRSRRLPANLIQAQRDFFGAHTYERIDEPGTFHTEWVEK